MKKVWTYWWLSFGLSVCCIVINYNFFRVSEMIKLEFAPTPEKMVEYILSTFPSSVTKSYHTLLSNTVTDYIFIAAYTLLTFFSFKILLTLFDVSMGGWVYIISIVTGLLDCMENNFLMNAAIRQQEEFSWLFRDIVRVKWAFAIIPVTLIPIVFIYGLIILLRNKQNDRNSAYNF